MIRPFKVQDADLIMKLWLETNVSAHSFINADYWRNNYDSVKEMLPDATLYIYEENNVVQGFIGLMNAYIAGMFVSQQFQSKGIGKKLLDHAKAENSNLILHVYKKNEHAVHFYLREGFVINHEQTDEKTGEIELEMTWISRNRNRNEHE
ncbi:Peptidyl-lysine N-acetyltransferase YiaC [Methanosarcinaceae archaeon Ag5]|uniref:Peptidyl-lysine N-acetyltransferase YiaC n=1 Tax=Methanolapillus africanus TaxID=3028297 RepID=A0AAE4MJ16_9EURY|nr:Peptidyl-lysine N-acetyltransferase YiaC [Methanosarcinaceae archaeon Ag5]